MKLPRDLSGTEVARRLARHYGYRVTRSRRDAGVADQHVS